MKFDYKYQGNELTVRFTGEIDEYACRPLRGEVDGLIVKSGLRRVIFDMQGVSFVDSTGLGFLLGRYKLVQAHGAELLIRGVSETVDKVLRTSGVYNFAPKIS